MAQQIVKWECFWVENRVIPKIQAGKNKHIFFSIGDEELIIDVCTYIKAQNDSMNKQFKEKIKNINVNYKIGINLYKLAQFVLEFIKTWRSGFYSYNNFSN